MNTNHPLRAWRLSKDLTVKQLAALIGVEGPTITSYELGRRMPRPIVMAAIESVTLRRVTASDFLPKEFTDASPGEDQASVFPAGPHGSAGHPLDGERAA